jgi:hypothetical protein
VRRGGGERIAKLPVEDQTDVQALFDVSETSGPYDLIVRGPSMASTMDQSPDAKLGVGLKPRVGFGARKFIRKRWYETQIKVHKQRVMTKQKYDVFLVKLEAGRANHVTSAAIARDAANTND